MSALTTMNGYESKHGCGRSRLPGAVLALLCALQFSSVSAAGKAEPDSPRWPLLQTHYFKDREIADGRAVIALVAPERASNAAVVPITVRANFPQSPERYVKTLTVLIDQNPVPLAGRFHLTPSSGKANISTRIRVNEYSYVRAIAELNDGSLHMVKKYVRAAGGCSAAGPRDLDATLARLGKMKLKRPSDVLLGHANRAQLLISHPNYTGMQMDSKSQSYIPAHFVNNVEVRYGGDLVMSIESDISLSEDPSFHFYYTPDKPGEMSVKVKDTADQTFGQSW